MTWLLLAASPVSLNPANAVDLTCRYAGPYSDKYSAGCADNCADYATLTEAIAACDLIQCKAITYSLKSAGGSNSHGATNGNWGYQLRASSDLSDSPIGEATWLSPVSTN